MARFIHAAKGQLFDAADCWLYSLGLALLVLSIALVPVNRMLADSGDGGSPDVAGCKANNGCNVSCQRQQNGTCPDPSNDYTNCGKGVQGCILCGCIACLDNTAICDCQCQIGLGSCTLNKCAPKP